MILQEPVTGVGRSAHGLLVHRQVCGNHLQLCRNQSIAWRIGESTCHKFGRESHKSGCRQLSPCFVGWMFQLPE